MRPDTILVSLIHVSNETGAVNDISKIADIVHTHPVCVFHADCTQSFGKLDIPFEKLDLMSMSAHKIHGLKGSALLLKRSKLVLQPLLFGGQQEQGLRGGTENAPSAIALAKTIRLALQEQPKLQKHLQTLQKSMREGLARIDGVKILSPENASDSILCICTDSVTSQVMQNALDVKGICVSAKSTCESSDGGANTALLAMGCTEKEATHNIRLSFSMDNTEQEVQEFLQSLKEIIHDYGLPV
jgi:cysteine desulfurase